MSLGGACALGLLALAGAAPATQPAAWDAARARGVIWADCARNVERLLQGWIDRKRDPETHLYSRGKTWDYHNEAADHYSSLVLMAFYVKPELLEKGGTLHTTLANSQRLCATPSGIPTTYDLARRAPGKKASFGALAEWLRDGLVRIVEVMGTGNDWYREMLRLVDAMLAEADRRGGIARAFRGHETCGNMLQTLARLHAMSGRERYLAAAEALADPFLLDPEGAVGNVRFGDHGCELVPGLAELFALECQLRRPKAEAYRKPLQQLLDRILATGAHPQTGLFRRANAQPPDTWGYVLFAYENADRGLGTRRYDAAVLKPLRWLARNRAHYARLKDTLWPRSSSSDDWSDSYESFIVLWNRYRHVDGAFAWLDWATRQHVHRRHGDRKYGPFTGGHFDGSAGRTLCLHMMLCSQGVRPVSYADGLRVGAVHEGGELLLAAEAETPWRGRLCFDGPRAEHRAASIRWARINEMPQWFVVRPTRRYSLVIDGGPPQEVDGSALLNGLQMDLGRGAVRRVRLRETARRPARD